MEKRKVRDMVSNTYRTKRRRTRRSRAMMLSKATWPRNALPVEIFTLIISYLPRSNIQKMRLVNKEFEEKVSEYLFKAVVVPFNPEIYGIAASPSFGGSSEARERRPLPGAVMLQDKGMRVFEGFGTRIRKFAMSFEFDEARLAHPPIKSEQEAITSFWGIYRWPYKRYNRYAQLEGLEQTADETRTMARAFRFIKCATELGLSIDGGLGWLSGPDINSKVAERGEKLAVFGESRFVPEPKPSPVRLGRSSRSSDPSSHRHRSAYTTYERMLKEAGYSEENLESSLRIMLETDEAAYADTFQAAPQPLFSNKLPASVVRNRRLPARSADASTIGLSASDLAELGFSDTSTTFSDGEDNPPHLVRTATWANALAQADSSKEKYASCSLKPRDLSTAQKEMLLEIEWAQSAFMQSYAIAVIDNPNTFKDIKTLTIARLPYRHLAVLRREDFWDSLAQLKTLSLAIIPDWREVVKLPTSWVEDNKLAPSQSVHGVYQLLQEQISHREKITTLHFEWLCGGEYSPGMFSRNQHILPAPVVPTAMDMVNRTRTPQILKLPHVVNLSLKNCWLSPHILCTFGLLLKRCSTACLTFESVSLCAPLPPNSHPTPIAVGSNNAPNLAAAAVQNAQLQLPPIAPLLPPINPPIPNHHSHNDPGHGVLEWLQPRPGSWSHVIEYLSPGLTLADIRYSYDIGPEPTRRLSTKLTKLEFKSCGYVRIPLNFDQTSLGIPEPHHTMTTAASKRYHEIETYMMKPADPTLGVIVNNMSAREEATLENAWNMNVFWDQSRAELAAECLLDGISSPGDGRFDGVITARPTK